VVSFRQVGADFDARVDELALNLLQVVLAELAMFAGRSEVK
jgi:hypothetical protein